MKSTATILATLQAHKPQFERYGVSSVGLFGSCSRNQQRDDSDIDLLIDFFPEKENFDNFMSIYDLMESLFKGEKIELITKKGLSKYIGPHILKDVIYA